MIRAFPIHRVRPVCLLLPVIAVTALLAGCGASAERPSETFSAEPFEVLDSSSGESWISMNGAGSRMLFGRHGEDREDHVIWESVRSGRTWDAPRQAPFSGSYSDRGARFYPALDAVVFSSNRPLAASDSTDDFNIWITQFDGESWSEPEPMTPLNTEANEIHPSVAADGTIWFSSDREGAVGGSDLWYARLGAAGYEVRRAPEPLNSGYSEVDAFIDPAGRYIIVSRTDDPAGLGGDDLFVSLRSGEAWTEPEHLGAVVNTTEDEYGPYVSRNGRTLFFTSLRGGTADIYRIAIDDLPVALPVDGLDTPPNGASGIDVTTTPSD